MKSAIELYKDAYELDYRHGDWEEAERIYNQIISQYPHSDEKEYAELHLERIQKLKTAGGEEEPLKPSRSKSGVSAGGVLGVIAFVFCVLMISAGAYFYYLFSEEQRINKSQSMMIQGFYFLDAGNYKNAELAFKSAHAIYPGDGLAYRMMIDAGKKKETTAP